MSLPPPIRITHPSRDGGWSFRYCYGENAETDAQHAVERIPAETSPIHVERYDRTTGEWQPL